VASQCRRFGHLQLGLLPARQDIKLNAKKLYRPYKEEPLTVRKRVGRRGLSAPEPMAVPRGHALRWPLRGFEKLLGSANESVVKIAP
jgi:hypothetical protein